MCKTLPIPINVLKVLSCFPSFTASSTRPNPPSHMSKNFSSEWISPLTFFYICLLSRKRKRKEEVETSRKRVKENSFLLFNYRTNTNVFPTKLNSHLMLFIVSIFYYIPNHIKSNGICSLIEFCPYVRSFTCNIRNHVRVRIVIL